MEQKIKKLVEKELKEISVEIDSVNFLKNNNGNTLDITLVSEDTIDLGIIVKASKIIKKALDEQDFIEEDYVLDCHSKGGSY